VVISIIAILIAVSIFGVQGAFEGARDSKRKSDLKQYQTALESYANKNNGLFPVQGAGGTIRNLCNTLGLGALPANCTEDPSSPAANYLYNYNSNDLGNGFASLYTMSTKLEGISASTFF